MPSSSFTGARMRLLGPLSDNETPNDTNVLPPISQRFVEKLPKRESRPHYNSGIGKLYSSLAVAHHAVRDLAPILRLGFLCTSNFIFHRKYTITLRDTAHLQRHQHSIYSLTLGFSNSSTVVSTYAVSGGCSLVYTDRCAKEGPISTNMHAMM